jgi:hypothetical protein
MPILSKRYSGAELISWEWVYYFSIDVDTYSISRNPISSLHAFTHLFIDSKWRNEFEQKWSLNYDDCEWTHIPNGCTRWFYLMASNGSSDVCYDWCPLSLIRHDYLLHHFLLELYAIGYTDWIYYTTSRSTVVSVWLRNQSFQHRLDCRRCWMELRIRRSIRLANTISSSRRKYENTSVLGSHRSV